MARVATLLWTGDRFQKTIARPTSLRHPLGRFKRSKIVLKVQLVKRRPSFDPSIPATPCERRTGGQDDLKNRGMHVAASAPIQGGRWRRLQKFQQRLSVFDRTFPVQYDVSVAVSAHAHGNISLRSNTSKMRPSPSSVVPRKPRVLVNTPCMGLSTTSS